MNKFDILENLGVVVIDSDKEEKFYRNIFNIISFYSDRFIPSDSVYRICQKIGIEANTLISCSRYKSLLPIDYFLKKILYTKSLDTVILPMPISFIEFLTRIIILFQDKFFENFENFKKSVSQSLEDCKLPYELCDGVIIPKGVKEYDMALVCDVAGWLSKYPNAHKSYKVALQQYYNDDEPRNIVDNLRLSLEAFLKEFLSKKGNLKNNISEIGTYLKDHNINSEISKMFTTLLTHYNNFNNDDVKHNDKTDKNSVEFLLYQTGVFMRFLLQRFDKI